MHHMRRAVLFAGAGLAVLAACSPDQAPTAPIKITPIDPTLELSVPGEDNPGNPPAHVDFIKGITRGAANGNGRGGGGPNPNLVYHGGPVMTTGAAVQAIFWGDWTSPGDKISGLDAFYGGIGGSGYARTNIEYPDGTGFVSAAVSYGGSVLDPSAAPSGAPSTATVLAEVCRNITRPVSNGYYPVYVSTSRGNAGYCAWHSAGACGGTPVQFAFFFRLDGDPGCDPQAGGVGGSQGLAALANVSGHELSEALTDPRLNAWYDRSGAENSDKCAWTFGGNVSFGGRAWKIQGNWSNNAYNNHTGYDATKGCIQTQ
jgi:hypothetical protein